MYMCTCAFLLGSASWLGHILRLASYQSRLCHTRKKPGIDCLHMRKIPHHSRLLDLDSYVHYPYTNIFPVTLILVYIRKASKRKRIHYSITLQMKFTTRQVVNTRPFFCIVLYRPGYEASTKIYLLILHCIYFRLSSS